MLGQTHSQQNDMNQPKMLADDVGQRPGWFQELSRIRSPMSCLLHLEDHDCVRLASHSVVVTSEMHMERLDTMELYRTKTMKGLRCIEMYFTLCSTMQTFTEVFLGEVSGIGPSCVLLLRGSSLELRLHHIIVADLGPHQHCDF